MTEIARDELTEMLAFAEALTHEASRRSLDYFLGSYGVELKRDSSPVTEADREIEDLIRWRIAERFPDHAVLGEERGHEPKGGAITWVIDPIDGTRSFVAGVPLYTVLIAAIEGSYDGKTAIPSSRSLVGTIGIPGLKSMVSAARGHGAWESTEGRREGASVSSQSEPENCVFCTTDFADLARRAPTVFEQVSKSGAQARTWGDAFGYYLVATGRAELMIDPIMNPWDVAPLPVIIEEAGGVFETLSGAAEIGTSAVAANGSVSLARLAGY